MPFGTSERERARLLGKRGRAERISVSNDSKDGTAISGKVSGTSKSAPGELRVRRWGAVGLVLLTTVAVGSISLWLVPPYWLIMAWLLAPPGGWRRSAGTAQVSESESDPEAAADPSMESQMPPPDEPTPPDEPLKPAKPARRKRSRPKKKAQEELPPPSVEATWVRVGPNQFVRVEVPVEPELEPEPALADPTPTEESVVHSVAAEPAADESDRLPVGDAPAMTETPRETPPSFAPEHPEPRTTEPEILAARPERRFDVAAWQARSWRPEPGSQGLGPNCRPLIGLRRNVAAGSGFPHDPGDEFRRA
jgi:hypothetical protein